MSAAIPVICLVVLAVSILGLIAHATASPEQKARIAARRQARIRFYVVNAGRGRATHLSHQPARGLALTLYSGATSTLCGLAATRNVNVFSPAEVSCRECRRRWELAQPLPQPPKPQVSEQARRLTASLIEKAGQAAAEGNASEALRYAKAAEMTAGWIRGKDQGQRGKDDA